MRTVVRLAGLLLVVTLAVTLAVTFVDRRVPDPPLVGRLIAVPAEVDEAGATGLPVVRQGWLVVPDNSRAPDWDRQLFPGEDLLHAPATRPGVDRVRIDVPAGRWIDPWTGELFEGGEEVRAWRPAPLGRPAVLVREGSPVAALLGPELLDPSVRP